MLSKTEDLFNPLVRAEKELLLPLTSITGPIEDHEQINDLLKIHPSTKEDEISYDSIVGPYYIKADPKPNIVGPNF